jgi:hypothetical protein
MMAKIFPPLLTNPKPFKQKAEDNHLAVSGSSLVGF